MIEVCIFLVVIGATLGVLWLARRHGIVLRPDALGLEAVPDKLVKKEIGDNPDETSHKL